MNTSKLPDSCFKSEQEKAYFQKKMNQWESIGKAFENMNRQLQENQKKAKEKQAKQKQAPRDVLVSKATKKKDIVKLTVVLRAKINEILQGDGDTNMKNMRANAVQSKLDALGRILSQIEREEREKNQIEREQRKKKKGTSEQVHITKEEQTLNDGQTGNTSVAPSFDAAASVSLSGENVAIGDVAMEAASTAIDVVL